MTKILSCVAIQLASHGKSSLYINLPNHSENYQSDWVD